MAKPRRVRGLRPEGRLRANARRVLSARIDEAHGLGGSLADPADVAGQHDLRIACKRLRYLLETFAPAFEADLGPFVARLRGLQDLLGDIHDRDVQIPELEAHLARLDEGSAAPEPPGAHRRGFEERAAGDERPGVRALIARRRAEREELHARAAAEWARMEDEGFRRRLESALGIG